MTIGDFMVRMRNTTPKNCESCGIMFSTKKYWYKLCFRCWKKQDAKEMGLHERRNAEGKGKS